MSTFLSTAKHPILKKWYPAIFIDDHFAHHRYGVKFLFPEEDMVDSNVFGKHHKNDYYITGDIVYDPKSYDIETDQDAVIPEEILKDWFKKI